MKIVARSITKEFLLNDRVRTVNNGVDLVINQGDFIGIRGKSGCGKSTFLNVICGMLRPTSGEVLYDDESLFQKSDYEISALRNKEIGYVMQDVCLLPNFTVFENILLPRSIFHANMPAETCIRARCLLEQMNLLWAEKNYPAQLSGGEARRVAIARALINRPSVLILDEATNDLDEETESEIMTLVRGLNQEGLSVLMVSHRSVNIGYASSVYEMHDGKLNKVR